MPRLLGFVRRTHRRSTQFFGTAVGQSQKSKNKGYGYGDVEELVPSALVGEHLFIVGVEQASVGIVQGELEDTDVDASASRRDN